MGAAIFADDLNTTPKANNETNENVQDYSIITFIILCTKSVFEIQNGVIPWCNKNIFQIKPKHKIRQHDDIGKKYIYPAL